MDVRAILFAVLLAPGLATAEGLHLDLGLGVHAEEWDRPEVDGMDNPLGFVRLVYELDERATLELEHTSSMPVWEDGYGFNTLSFRYRVF
ncbi:MAG: hypothetical protein GWO16_08335 [Gammaproteobacteria bacterium]|nr:hypothetical protein [Gammaproteobacteria bacterium]NIR97955.1 hypothetical protein [Gammaproteobacteria bacterium]NIT63656.1 hypothetical protein [Gammaproteobacteria bacterium]NIV21514.1 hypothetical protein [Gammaproteobacteria bacterium]NIY32236.1 hypothetical protein [Gammaproteobacteria bacterium]